MLLLKAVSLAVILASQAFTWSSTPEGWLTHKAQTIAQQKTLQYDTAGHVVVPSRLYRLPQIPEASVVLTASKYGLVDLYTGFWLNAKDKTTLHAPASLTKLMTALVVLDQASDLNKLATVSEKAVAVEGKKIDLVPGERLSIKILLSGMLVASGNDAALVLAEKIGGSVSQFVTLMNDKARELGLKNTTFRNPTGLDAAGHMSTVEDLLLLARFFWSNTERARYTQQASVTLPGSGRRFVTRKFYSTNELIAPKDFQLWGAKTGTTDEAGESVLYAAKKQDLTLVSLILDSEARFLDCAKLLNWGFKPNF